MFRGEPPSPWMLAALGGHALVVFVISTMLLRRRFRT
jgi:hypothetical protein